MKGVVKERCNKRVKSDTNESILEKVKHTEDRRKHMKKVSKQGCRRSNGNKEKKYITYRLMIRTGESKLGKQ